MSATKEVTGTARPAYLGGETLIEFGQGPGL